MELTYFKARDYRNIEQCNIPFTPGVNLLLGENAQGKTNVMEGIYLFSRGKSHRGASDREMTRFGCEGFSLEIGYKNERDAHSLGYVFLNGDRRRTRDGIRLERITEMLGNFRSVLFCPDHLTLVKGGPEERRRFLDVGISGADSAYIKYYSSYKHALEQRNALLRRASKGDAVDQNELLCWSHLLSEYASYLYIYRSRYCDDISSFASLYLGEISGGERLSLRYLSDIKEELRTDDRETIQREYEKIFTRALSRECAFGSTLFGPLRDDIEILLSDKEARHFASQGQQRSIVLAMKNAEGKVCHKMTGERAVYLLDDVLSELDEGRQRFLLAEQRDTQVIISSCTRPSALDGLANVIEVSKGEYRVSSRG